MGKQLSIYLNEVEAKRLTEIAIRECRRPHDQAKYFLLSALGLTTNSDNVSVSTSSKSAVLTYQGEHSAFADINP